MGTQRADDCGVTTVDVGAERHPAVRVGSSRLKGAGAGAVVGGVAGRRRSKREQQAAQAGAQNDWARAFAACMESKGYSVK